jgi:hypothetical protein
VSRPGGQTTAFATDASATVTNTSAQIIAIGLQRGALLIHNPSATVSMAIAPTPTVPVIGSVGLQLPPGGTLFLDGPKTANAFNGIASAAGPTNVVIWVWN